MADDIRVASALAQVEVDEAAQARVASALAQVEIAEPAQARTASVVVQVEYYELCVDGLAAEAVSSSAIGLTWARESDPDSYTIERADSSDGPWAFLASVDGPQRGYQDSELDPGTTYYYRVRTFEGADYSNPSLVVHAATVSSAPVDIACDILLEVTRPFYFEVDTWLGIGNVYFRDADTRLIVRRGISLDSDTLLVVGRVAALDADSLLVIRSAERDTPTRREEPGLDFLGKGLRSPFAFQRRSGGAQVSTATSSNHAHIHESIRQILGTRKGERLMRPEFGTRLHELVFEPNDSLLYGLLRHEVIEALEEWEPRVIITDVSCGPDETNGHLVLVRLNYRLISSQVEGNLVYPFYRELE